jgi:hypothetical protein
MADYGKIAQEEKSKQDAVGFAANAKLRDEEASSSFFKSIETGLNKEIGKANPELQKHGLLEGHQKGGITMPPKRFDTQIRLSYGQVAFCEVNYDQKGSMVNVEMVGEAKGGREAVPKKLAFHIANAASGAIAHKMDADQETAGDVGAGDIAEIVVEGLIRGYF